MGDIKIDNVPLWLQDSDLFKNSLSMGLSLHSGLFPHECIRECPTINDFSDFVSVLKCVDYWGVEIWPNDIYVFIALHPAEVKVWRDANGSAIANHLDLCDRLLDILLSGDAACKFDLVTASLGSIGWLKYWRSSGRSWSEEVCNSAAEGHVMSGIPSFKWLRLLC